MRDYPARVDLGLRCSQRSAPARSPYAREHFRRAAVNCVFKYSYILIPFAIKARRLSRLLVVHTAEIAKRIHKRRAYKAVQTAALRNISSHLPQSVLYAVDYALSRVCYSAVKVEKYQFVMFQMFISSKLSYLLLKRFILRLYALYHFLLSLFKLFGKGIV